MIDPTGATFPEEGTRRWTTPPGTLRRILEEDNLTEPAGVAPDTNLTADAYDWESVGHDPRNLMPQTETASENRPFEVHQLHGGTLWYFWNETWTNMEGPFITREEAEHEMQRYAAWLDWRRLQPEPVVANPGRHRLPFTTRARIEAFTAICIPLRQAISACEHGIGPEYVATLRRVLREIEAEIAYLENSERPEEGEATGVDIRRVHRTEGDHPVFVPTEAR